MPRLKTRPPSYRLHKASGHAIVTIDGRDHYLGKYGTPESRARYKQIVAQWAATNTDATTNGCHRVASHDDLRISELFLAYLEFARRYYVKNGRPTGEVANLKDAIRPTSGTCLPFFPVMS